MKTPSIATLTLHVCTVLLVAAIALAGCAAERARRRRRSSCCNYGTPWTSVW